MKEYIIWIENCRPGIEKRNQYLGGVNANNKREAEEAARKLFSNEIYGFSYGNETRLIIIRRES